MFQRVLVPLDGSVAGEAVLPYVRALAGRLRVPVALLHVVDRAGLPMPSRPSAPAQGRPEDAYLTGTGLGTVAERAAERYLSGVAARFAGGPVGVTTTVRVGDAAGIVVSDAAGVADTLIAMTTAGRSGVGRLAMGSVAGKVLQTAASALLLVRVPDGAATGEALIDRVITPLDGSMLSERALQTAAGVAQGLGVPVLVVRVVAPLERLYLSDTEQVAGLAEMISASEEEADEYVKAKTEQVRAMGLTAAGRVLHGYPATQLLELAHKHPRALVVMSTHGRSGMARALLGSVTDRVARGSGQPVLVVRP